VTPRSSVPTGVLALAGAVKAAELAHRRGGSATVEPLAGSVALAAQPGLADAVADLVETGRTLRENGLHPVADWLEVAPNVIANRAASFLRGDEIDTRRRTLGGRT
jgi:ATP phosphoribosyltransferase